MTLDEWLREHQITDAAFARQSGVGLKQLIGRYRRGLSRPSFQNIEKIMIATSGAVTANDFLPSGTIPTEEARV